MSKVYNDEGQRRGEISEVILVFEYCVIYKNIPSPPLNGRNYLQRQAHRLFRNFELDRTWYFVVVLDFDGALVRKLEF